MKECTQEYMTEQFIRKICISRPQNELLYELCKSSENSTDRGISSCEKNFSNR